MKTNEELQKDVQDAIKWQPLLNAAEIGVTVKDGVVTLFGNVDSYTKKLEVENAAKNVAGVKALVEDITIKFGTTWNKSDSDIATDALNVLKGNWQVISDRIKVKVENGWVILSGEQDWNYQKDAAKILVSNLFGVTGVTNNITFKSLTNNDIERKDVESALARNWSLSNQEIHVEVSDHRVILTGTVNSLYQKDEAEKIAFNALGVWAVTNELEINYNYALSI
jgi:osmotically-inducible protein OsmY